MGHDFITIYCAQCGFEHAIPKYCGDRFCPECGRRRLFLTKQRLEALITAAKTDGRHRLKHIVLTLRNQSNCGAMVRDLLRSFKKLRDGALWKNKVSGGCYIIEVTGGENDWHVHLHILAYSTYFPQKQLSAAWKKVSNSFIVWVSDASKGNLCNYLLSYVTKAPLDVVSKAEVNQALRGTRMFQPFGDWHSMQLPKFKYRFMCPDCNSSIWLSEFELRQYSPTTRHRARSGPRQRARAAPV